MNVIVPNVADSGEVWKGSAKFAKQLETVQMTAAKIILRGSSTTGNTVSIAELGIYRGS